MAGMKEIWAEAKGDMKKNNDKFANDMRKNAERTKAQSRVIGEEGRMKREQINAESPSSSKFGVKNWLALWGAVATLPLFLFGIFLVFVAVMIIISIF